LLESRISGSSSLVKLLMRIGRNTGARQNLTAPPAQNIPAWDNAPERDEESEQG